MQSTKYKYEMKFGNDYYDATFFVCVGCVG